jgi:hypothetical protein
VASAAWWSEPWSGDPLGLLAIGLAGYDDVRQPWSLHVPLESNHRADHGALMH